MNAEKTQELYTKIVFWFADHCPDDWNKAHINIEMLLEQSELAQNWQLRCFVGDQNQRQDLDVTA